MYSLGPERRGERNQVMNTATGETMKKMIPQVDKALKTLNLPVGDKFMFGDTISVADLQVPMFRNAKLTFSAYNLNFFLPSKLEHKVPLY